MSNRHTNEVPQDGSGIDYFLPYGEMLRPLLASEKLGKSELKKILSNKGVFVSSSDKAVTIPLICTSLLSPTEFEYLRELQTTKESKPKRRTQNIQWDSEDQLKKVLTKITLPVDQIVPPKTSNYRMITPPRLIPKPDGTVEIKYEVERIDTTKDWASTKARYGGQVAFKLKNGKGLVVSSEYTSPETKDVNDRVIKSVIKQCKEKGHINRDRVVEKITFGSFSNDERIKFLLSLQSDDPLGVLTFHDITNVEFQPDTTKLLPEEIDWMQDKVKKLQLDGQKLHFTLFLKDRKFHDSLIFQVIVAEFKFDYKAAKGKCTLEYGFFPSRRGRLEAGTEFEVRVKSLELDKGYQVPKKKVERYLLGVFDEMKAEKYEEFKKQNSSV